jgi:hypothetical protein
MTSIGRHVCALLLGRLRTERAASAFPIMPLPQQLPDGVLSITIKRIPCLSETKLIVGSKHAHAAINDKINACDGRGDSAHSFVRKVCGSNWSVLTLFIVFSEVAKDVGLLPGR